MDDDAPALFVITTVSHPDFDREHQDSQGHRLFPEGDTSEDASAVPAPGGVVVVGEVVGEVLSASAGSSAGEMAGEVVPVEPTRTTVERSDRDFVEPVRRLNATLSDILDVDANPDRDPEEALSLLKSAMDTFQEESANWLD